VSELVEFLRARLDEDEAVVEMSGPHPVAWLTYRDTDGQMLYTTVASSAYEQVGNDPLWIVDGKEVASPAHYTVVYNPAKVRREIAAKRLVLEECEYWEERVEAGAVYEGKPANPVKQRSDEAQGVAHRFEATQRVLMALGLAYADHPDFKEEWRV
jgi:hypothetical protein